MTRYELFDLARVQLADLAERGHDLSAEDCLPLETPGEPYDHPEFPALVERIRQARRNRRPVIVPRCSGRSPR